MIIRAHSVPILPSGLSAMQERLLRSDRFVRLVSAPTGSGKSYAFMRAVLDDNARVLFIVPTKRLLQNLIEDAREQATRQLDDRGWTKAQIDGWLDERITEWSGNQTTDGRETLATKRVRELLSGGGHPGGRVIFAIPEVVVRMTSGVRLTGASAVNPFLYPRMFDHIVFDEFHTIDDRSFGLACLFSLLAVSERQGKVSLLSATPIDVTHVLKQTGVAVDDVAMVAEAVVDGHAPGNRPIHGDVTVLVRECSIPESMALSIDAVRTSLRHRRTIIAIYDSLARLKKDEPEIRATLRGVGVAESRLLLINSIDDSERRPGEPRRGVRYKDPREYDVLVCTSSVEVGVTFHSALMFTEPGHGLASFVQRVGRVARGAADGQVIVSLPERRRDRQAWTRRIGDIVERHDELHVQEFLDEILRDVRRRLEPTRKEAEFDAAETGGTVPYFRRVSWRGLFWSALFIAAVRRTKMNVQKEAKNRLSEIAPPTVRRIEARIQEILSVDVVNPNQRQQSQPHKRWVKALLTSALTYRDIGATLVVVDPDDTRHTVTESFLRRATDILGRHVVCDEDGERVVHLFSRTLNQELTNPLRDEREAQRLTLYIPSPIGQGDFSLSINEFEKGTEQLHRRLVEAWQEKFRPFLPAPGEIARDPRTRVIAAATELVEKLGRPPLEEDFEDAATESALFA